MGALCCETRIFPPIPLGLGGAKFMGGVKLVECGERQCKVLSPRISRRGTIISIAHKLLKKVSVGVHPRLPPIEGQEHHLSILPLTLGCIKNLLTMARRDNV